MKYTKDMPRRLIAYYSNLAQNGQIPFLVNFCLENRIEVRTAHSWVEKYAEFKKAYEECKQIQASMIEQCALNRRVDASFAQFLLRASHGYKTENQLRLANTQDASGASQPFEVNIKVVE